MASTSARRGVGLAIDSLRKAITFYREKYDRTIFFIDRAGAVVLHDNLSLEETGHIREMDGLSLIADRILSSDNTTFQYSRDGGIVHLNTRFLPELDWYLLVEQTEEAAIGQIYGALITTSCCARWSPP